MCNSTYSITQTFQRSLTVQLSLILCSVQFTVDADLRTKISTSLNMLCESRATNEAFIELDAMAAFVQWTLDEGHSKMPDMPVLWKLKGYAEEVDVPWRWDCKTGKQFEDEWKASSGTAGFWTGILELVKWWHCRKKVRAYGACKFGYARLFLS